MQQEAPPNKVLGVWGLSSRSREEDVRDMFTKLIELEQVSLITDRRVSALYFAYITLPTHNACRLVSPSATRLSTV
jgi:RNA recognition motif-containing protein